MAVRFDAGGDWLNTTTNLVDYNGNYTIMAHFYLTTDTNDNTTFFTLLNSTSNYDLIATGTDGTTLASQVRVGGAATDAAGTSLNIGQWYHIAVVRSSVTNLTIYLDGVSDSTNARSVSGRAAIGDMSLGQFISGDQNRLDGRIHSFKWWSTDLTAAEINSEMHTELAKIKLSSLNRNCPTLPGATERVRDYGPNADDLTANGTLTDEAPPPVSWGGEAQIIPFPSAAISAATTGTATASITEADIVSGGKTIILTLTGDTWVAAGATFDAQRQNIIDGIDSAQAEATGWDAEVKAKEVVTAVVRTSSTVVTITLTAAAAYDITAQETITATIPATALVTSVSAVVASPTFTVDAVAAGGRIMGSLANNGGLAGFGGIAGQGGGLAG